MHEKQDLATDLFHFLISATKGVVKAVWGSEGLEGLTGPQFGILVHLYKIGHLSPSELSDRVSVTAGNMTGMITRLKKLGYVERRRLTADRRQLRIALSAKGLSKVEETLPIWRKRVRECFQPIPEAQKKQLITLLGQLCQTLPVTICTPLHGKEPTE